MNFQRNKCVLNDLSLGNLDISLVRADVLSIFYWHKVVIKNTHGESRDDVLQSIMDAVDPNDFVPVNYKCSIDGSATFLLKNCGQALMMLWNMKLVFPHYNKHKTDINFHINIILKEVSCNDFKIDLQPIIVNVLKKRYVKEKKLLNLEEFHLDPDLIHYTPLSQRRLLNFIFHLSNQFEIVHLVLKNNCLTRLKSFEVLLKGNTAKTLKTLDISNNKIESLDDVKYLKDFPINELILDNNPLCNDFTENEYISSLKTIFPELKSLDSVDISPSNRMEFYRTHYLCNYSAEEFVDNFMEHYFSLYDDPKDRILLKDMYHENAVFTLTSRLLSGQKSTSNTIVAYFQKFSHNIKSFVGTCGGNETVFIGPDNIVKLFTSFPLSTHDPSIFTVDLTHFKEDVSIITITGVFKNISESVLEMDLLYNFMRTFILKKNPATEEHQIINDILNVTNVTSVSETEAFKYNCNQEKYIRIPLAKSRKERNKLAQALQLITNLRIEWARKCLQECAFDIRRSLMLFVDLLKANQFPQEAFREHHQLKKY